MEESGAGAGISYDDDRAWCRWGAAQARIENRVELHTRRNDEPNERIEEACHDGVELSLLDIREDSVNGEHSLDCGSHRGPVVALGLLSGRVLGAFTFEGKRSRS